MTLEKFPCKRHPDRFSSRKCYQCKEYLCSICQTIYNHHIFCGKWCFFKYLITQNGIKLNLSREFLILLVILSLTQILLFLLLRNEIYKEFYSTVEPVNQVVSYEDSTMANPTVTLDTAIIHTSQFMNISGETRDNTVLGLWHNGEYTSTAISKNGKYEFPLQHLFLGKNIFVLWALFKDGSTSLIDSFSVNYHSARLYTLSKSVERIMTTQKVISLTFDAGSIAYGADSIIQILRRQNIRATFFLTGIFIKNYPDIIQDLIEDGHELANHTYSHPHLTNWEQNHSNHMLDYVNRNFIYQQLNRTDSLFYTRFNQHLKPLWRAPFGEYNEQILTWAAELGYRHVKWSNQCDTWDWVSDKESPLYRTPNEIYAHLINLLINEKLNGAIVLMHFGSNRENDFPYEMLSKLIISLKEQKYKILTVSRLLSLLVPT